MGVCAPASGKLGVEERRGERGSECHFWRVGLEATLGVCRGAKISQGPGFGELPRGQRTDNAVAPEEVRVAFVHVHAPAHALARAVDPPHELRHDLQRRPPAAEVRAVIAVGGDDRILLREGGFHADAHRLLAVVQVAEPADELALVEDVRRDLEAPHEVRLGEHIDDLGL